MKLSTLIKEIEIKEVIGDIEREVSRLDLDSRNTKPGSCFFAIKGSITDGHLYIDEALENGAIAIICDKLPKTLREHTTYVLVTSSQKAVGPMASAFFSHPSKKMKLVGITGTNGKTTIATLLYNLFELLGTSSSLIGTIENYIHKKKLPASYTTPDAISLNKLLNQMAAEGCRYVFMEVSSHAAAQDRIRGLVFAGGVFTNLTHDHLDYHLTMERYLKAKKKFFDLLSAEAFVLANKDDEYYSKITKDSSARPFTYAIYNKANFNAQVLEINLYGTSLLIDDTIVKSKLIGLFNVYNILAVYATAVLLEIDKAKVLELLPKLSAVRGRLELLQGEILGIVDYAHTPDALKNLLETVNDLKRSDQKVICVIGCGGDRDLEKRPIMAQIAYELVDKVIFTSDNPRSENPIKIINEMCAGIFDKNTDKLFKIPDRKEAIHKAVQLAYPGGIVVIAGKGHEVYQEIEGKKYPFDDKQILKDILINNNRKILKEN